MNLKNVGITGISLVGIFLLVSMGLGSIVTGTLSLWRIDDTLNEITDVAAPTVETVGDVTVHVGTAQRLALEVLADEEPEDAERLKQQYAQAADLYKASIAELDVIVSDPALQRLVEETHSEWASFDGFVQQMFVARATELSEEATADQQTARFEAEGAALIARLETFSQQQEVEMQASEDRADVLAERPTTTANDLNDLIGELFEVDYPAYAAAMELQLIVSLLEGAAREYMASEMMGELADIRREFVDTFNLAAPYFRTLADRTETASERDFVSALERDFNAWVQNAEADEQLFDTHRDMLTAEQEADDFAAQMDEAAEVLLATLEGVADAADAVSDGADDLAAEQLRSSQLIMSIMLLGMIAFGAGIAWTSARFISKPIRELTETMEQMTSGNLDTKLEPTDRTNEVGKMTNALVVFLDGEVKRREQEAREKARTEETARVVQGLSNALSELSNGDLTTRINMAFGGDFEVLKENFNTSLERLQSILKEVIAKSETISGGSDGLSSAAENLAIRTEQQAAALTETVATVGQIKGSVETTASSADAANSMVVDTRQLADDGSGIVKDMVAAMDEIEKGSKQISQIIGTIDDIAFQTNLLALNAGVEAARAGEAGRGFAVVASEVRALAQRAGEAAKEIKDLIETSQGQVANGARLTLDADGALQKISEKVVQVSEKVSEINAAAQSQAQGVSEISIAMNDLDNLTQQNAAMVEETTAAAVELKSDVSDLRRGASVFKTGTTAEIIALDQAS